MVVYIKRVKDYKECKKPLLESLEKSLLKLSFPIFIKPNILGLYRRNSAIITHPLFVYALIEALKDMGAAAIYIGDIPQIGLRSKDVAKVFDEGVLKRYGARYILLDEEEKVKVRWRFGTLSLPRILKESFYINLPKFKTHILTKLTLSLKNQKGLLDQDTKQRFHKDYPLEEAIAHLAKVIFPDFVIVDGVWALHGQGPATGGKRIKLGLVVAGRNAVEVDSVCAKIAGFEPEDIVHIREAASLGLGSMEPEIVGELKRAEFLHPLPYIKKWRLYVWGTSSACSGCLETLAKMKRRLHHPLVFYKAVKNFLFSKTHILLGKGVCLPKMEGRLICFGECTKELAQKHNLFYIKGCPPTFDSFLKSL